MDGMVNVHECRTSEHLDNLGDYRGHGRRSQNLLKIVNFSSKFPKKEMEKKIWGQKIQLNMVWGHMLIGSILEAHRLTAPSLHASVVGPKINPSLEIL